MSILQLVVECPEILGLIFQLLAWIAALQFANNKAVLKAGCWTGLAILSHPNSGLWTVAGLTAFTLCDGLIGRRQWLIIMAISAMFSAPWWGSMLIRHGLEPFFMALQHGGQDSNSWRLFAFWPE